VNALPRKTRLVKGYADLLAAGTMGVAGLGALNAVGTATGTGNTALMGMAGSAMSIGAVGMPLMAAGNLMGQINTLGQMTGAPRKRRGRR
jgi:hypothetical protein